MSEETACHYVVVEDPNEIGPHSVVRIPRFITDGYYEATVTHTKMGPDGHWFWVIGPLGDNTTRTEEYFFVFELFKDEGREVLLRVETVEEQVENFHEKYVWKGGHGGYFLRSRGSRGRQGR